MVKVGRGEWQVVTAGWVKIGDLGWGEEQKGDREGLVGDGHRWRW